jgi:hypothetical protein
VPVVFEVVGGVAVEGLQVAADAGGVNARRTTVGVPVADEVEDVAAGGGVRCRRRRNTNAGLALLSPALSHRHLAFQPLSRFLSTTDLRD